MIREQVSDFHRANGVPILDTPQVPADERVRLRLRLIAEEFCELLAASLADGEGQNSLVDHIGWTLREHINSAAPRVDLVEVADALADLDYVIEGTRLEFGIDGAPIAAEIHRSNMSKLGPDGKPVLRPDGKITKGPSYSPPDVARELLRQGWKP